MRIIHIEPKGNSRFRELWRKPPEDPDEADRLQFVIPDTGYLKDMKELDRLYQENRAEIQRRLMVYPPTEVLKALCTSEALQKRS